jgi:hypothetical protein
MMATTHERLGAALDRIAAGTSVHRVRASDAARSARNGATKDERLLTAVVHLEIAAHEIWTALDLDAPSELQRAA